MEDLVKARKVGMELYERFVEIGELAENHPDPVVREKLSDFLETFSEWMKFMDERVRKIDDIAYRVEGISKDVRTLKLKVL